MTLLTARRALLAALLVAAFIAYGSLYPLRFRALPADFDLAALLAAAPPLRGGRGDALANLALYMPLGLALALWWRGRGAVAVATLLGAALSLALEVAQLFTPQRVASPWDFALNTAGSLAGALVAPLLLRLGGGLDRPALGDRFALLLLACWLATRLHPYLPSLDLGEWRASLSPLLREGIDVGRAARLAVLWWLAARLTEAALPRGAWLVPLLVAGTLAAAVPITARVLTWAEVAGAFGGLLLWLVLRRQHALLAVAMVGVVLAEGLAPYRFLDASRGFSFVPFGAAIGGSFGAGMQAILTKGLLFGGLFWALRRAGIGFAPALAGVTLLALGVSVAQMWLPGRSAEISDALIALAAGLAAWLLRPSGAAGWRALESHRPRGETP